MHSHRAGEQDKTVPFRNERYFCINGEWFFETRNGDQQGPFPNKKEMEAELILFIRDTAMAINSITN